MTLLEVSDWQLKGGEIAIFEYTLKSSPPRVSPGDYGIDDKEWESTGGSNEPWNFRYPDFGHGNLIL